MMESILNNYHEKKKQEEQYFDRFEKLIDVMLYKFDIATFERTISKIVHDGYVITVNNTTHELPSKSIEIIHELFKMFSEENIKNPVKSFTDNIHICTFIDDIRPYNCYSSKCTDFMKRCNEMIKQSINDKIVDLQKKKDRTPEEEALLEKSLNVMELITSSCY